MKSIKKYWQLYLIVAIPTVYLLVFRYIPMLGNVIAFRTYLPGGSVFGQDWVGLRYFQMFIGDATFWQVFLNTLSIGIWTLIFTFPLPIIFALLLNEVKNRIFKKFIQTASYLPYFLSIVIIAGMILDFTSSNGFINNAIHFFGGTRILFMQDPKWFQPIYVISQVWQTLGWGSILYLAALTNIDDTLYEAAKMDGANRWQQMLHVTLPGILPTIITMLVLNVGSVLGVGFEKVLLLQNPLVYSTGDVVSTYLYRVGILSSNFSYATAIGIFVAIIGLVLVLGSNRISAKITKTSLW